MSRRMTIVFDDEELYTALKVAAARTHRPAKDLVADALQLMFAATSDEHATILMRTRVKAYAKMGGTPVGKILEELGLTKEPAPVRE